MFIIAATNIGMQVRFTTCTGFTSATPAIATIAAVIGEHTRPKLVIICIGKTKLKAGIPKDSASFGAKDAKEKNAALPLPIRNAHPAITKQKIIIRI